MMRINTTNKLELTPKVDSHKTIVVLPSEQEKVYSKEQLELEAARVALIEAVIKHN